MSELVELRTRVAELDAENADLRAIAALVGQLEARVEEQERRVAEQLAENEELRATIAVQQARIEELERRLGLNSGNSSKPPSSDAPWTKPRKRGRPKKRKRGGQKGHAGRNRALMPTEKVDEIHDHRPGCCTACNALLLGDDPAPWRWQVVEIPEPRVKVIEHRVHRLRCPVCGQMNQGETPAETTSAFGTRVHATTAWLTGRLGVSKRNVQEILKTLFNLEMSVGSVSAMERRVAAALEEPYAEAWAHARASPVVHPDETPWYEDRRLAWLWVLATREVTVFRIQERRNGDAAKTLIGEDFTGAACTDRHGAYNWIEQRGLCWAHIRRNFEAMADAPGGDWYGRRLRAAASRIITTWYQHARGEIDAETMHRAIAADRCQVEDVLAWAATQVLYGRLRRQAEALLEQTDQLWTFLEVQDMPPDNNIAERAMRRGVMWRKRSFGTDSPAGSRFAERILTAVETLRSNDRDVVQFLGQAYDAHINQRPAPSLLP